MAAAINELFYRTFDQLLDACRIDLYAYQQSGDIDAANLIKRAQAINYELGLKIHMAKETVVDIEHSRAKLPADFYQLQIALLCHHYRNISTAPWNGNVWLEEVVKQSSGTTCDICEVTHVGATCPIVIANPYIEGKTRTICNGETEIKVLQFCASTVYCYEYFERLYIVPNTQASAFCLNRQFKGCSNQGQINGGFIETSVDCGKLYLSYLGAMEDDEGNLLVLDHPKINLYYEADLQYTILRNLYMNGTPDIERRLAFVKDERDKYRQQALSIANTPDYRQVIQTGEVVRNMARRRFYNPLDKWHGYTGWANPIDYIISNGS